MLKSYFIDTTDELLLSIAVPNFNGGENLKRALSSCQYINLPLHNFEILVCDNSSTDNSVEIVEQCKRFLPNIKLIQNPTNIGRVENWNRVIKLARGKHLLFLFANDEIKSSNHIARIIWDLKFDDDVLVWFKAYIEDRAESLPRINFDWSNHISRVVNNLFNDFNFGGLGVLQQYIFPLRIIQDARVYFDAKYPRTTDRRFIVDSALAVSGNVKFYAKTNVIWHAVGTRYHSLAHNTENDNELILGEEFESTEYILNSIGEKKNLKPLFKAYAQYLMIRGFLNNLKFDKKSAHNTYYREASYVIKMLERNDLSKSRDKSLTRGSMYLVRKIVNGSLSKIANRVSRLIISSRNVDES